MSMKENLTSTIENLTKITLYKSMIKHITTAKSIINIIFD